MEILFVIGAIILIPLALTVFGISLFVNAIETIKREMDK